MKTAKITAAVLTAAALATAFLSPPRTANAAGAAPVQVVNTPLPVSGNVNATVTGNVGATVTGTVGLASGTTVNIGSGAVELTGNPSVQIGNPATDPVLTRDVDRTGLQRYVDGKQVLCADGAFFCGTNSFDAVPAGKRLVVEHVWARADLPGGQAPLVTIFIGVNIPVSLPLQTHFFGTDIFVGGGPMQFHVDNGGLFSFNAARNATAGTGIVNLTVSGYLIDVP